LPLVSGPKVKGEGPAREMGAGAGRSGWWRDWLALGLTFGGGLILFNALFGRFPIYLLVPGRPFLSIPVGMALEMAFWCFLSSLVGLLVEACRKICRGNFSWHRGVQVSVLLVLEAFLTVVLLDVMMRRGLFRFFAPPPPRDNWLFWGMPVISGGAGIAVTLACRNRPAELRECDGRNLGLLALLFSAVWAAVFNRTMATTQLPFPLDSSLVLLKPHLVPLAGVFLGLSLLWFVAARWRWTISHLARNTAITAMAATIFLAIYYWYPSGEKRPHILVSLWDAARAGRMSVYGYSENTTPFLGELADRAVIFDQAVTPANYTLPSHASFFLGLPYRAHGYHIGDGRDVIRYRGEITLPDRLREISYHPVLFSENPWVMAVDKGFAEARFFEKMGLYADLHLGGGCEMGAKVSPRRYPNSFPGRMLLDWLEYGRDGFYAPTLDNIQLRAVAELFLRSRRTGPVFLFWNLMNVHDRYHPYGNWKFGQLVDNYDFAGEYDLGIRYSDARFERLYRLVESLGELPRTLFLVTSDHGEFLGEFNLVGHHKGLFEPVLRVPLVVLHQDFAPRRVAAPVSLSRFFDLVEAAATGKIQAEGGNLPEVLRGRDIAVAEHGYLEGAESREFQWSYAVFDQGRQFVYDPQLRRHNSSWPADKKIFLFDFTSGPDSEEDISGNRPEVVENLRGLYLEYLRELPSVRKARRQEGLHNDLERQLRAVGYLR